MDRVQQIVETGLFQKWSTQNIISCIESLIATDEEINLILSCGYLPELTEKAEALYKKYSEIYFLKNNKKE